MNDDAIIDYTNKILIHSPVELESNVDQQLFKNLYEILSNAVEHSHANMAYMDAVIGFRKDRSWHFQYMIRELELIHL